MRMLYLFSATVLLITNMICFVGCSSDDIVDDLIGDPTYEDGHSVIKDAYIAGIEISISESRPAQVMVTATAFHHNTCVSSLEIHQKRSGNTISLWGEMEVIEEVVCGDAITEVQKQVSIGEFMIGEYKVIADDLQLVFHIEDDESWVIRSPLIESIDFSISASVPAQVTVNVEGYFCEAAIPFLKTHQRQEEDIIYIQMTSKVPSSISCPLVIHRDFLINAFSWSLVKHQKEISIGEFTTGHYEVVVNGIEESFFVE